MEHISDVDIDHVDINSDHADVNGHVDIDCDVINNVNDELEDIVIPITSRNDQNVTQSTSDISNDVTSTTPTSIPRRVTRSSTRKSTIDSTRRPIRTPKPRDFYAPVVKFREDDYYRY